MIVRLIVSAIAVGISAWFLEGVTIEPWWATVIVALVLGLINAIIRPVVKLFSLPINMLTLGLFTFVINALMVLLCAWFVGDYFKLEGTFFEKFCSAFVFSIVLTVVNWVLHLFVKK